MLSAESDKLISDTNVFHRRTILFKKKWHVVEEREMLCWRYFRPKVLVGNYINLTWLEISHFSVGH